MADASYSPFFHSLYDERAPVGSLGRGTHYSVLSAAQWVDNRRRLLPQAAVQRFAVIWDEDHDTRVIQVAEAAYMAGIFAPVLYIGERKANLTVVVNEEFFEIIGGDRVSYSMAWEELPIKTHGDSWNLNIVRPQHGATGMVLDDDEKVGTYLRNIHNLWSLGVTPYVPGKLPLSSRLQPSRDADSAA